MYVFLMQVWINDIIIIIIITEGLYYIIRKMKESYWSICIMWSVCKYICSPNCLLES